MKDEFYAHSLFDKQPEEWHRLEDHLKSVAEMARKFANDFNAGEWAYLAGIVFYEIILSRWGKTILGIS